MAKKTELKLTHIPLHCPICKKRFMNMLGQPLPNHAQIRCTTPEGNEMDLGICEKCVESGVTLEMCNAILEGIKDHWIYEIDINKSLKVDEKTKRKEFHKSHTIESVTEIIATGKRAENEARKKKMLQ
jgi:hypothetical protein